MWHRPLPFFLLWKKILLQTESLLHWQCLAGSVRRISQEYVYSSLFYHRARLSLNKLVWVYGFGLKRVSKNKKELFILFTESAFRKLPSIYVFSYFPFGFEGRIWDLIVTVPDHCLSFYFSCITTNAYFATNWAMAITVIKIRCECLL